MRTSSWVKLRFKYSLRRVIDLLYRASAVLAIGAATLADIFEPRERGTMMGIYYAAPLLGPSLGPIAGGILTQLFTFVESHNGRLRA